MEELKKLYRRAYEEHGDSPKSVLWPKGRQEDRFLALTRHIPSDKKKFTILDFGCGLAHLKPYLDERFQNVSYTGVDIVDEFVQHNCKKFPSASFYHPDELFSNKQKFDYVVSSGTFNILYASTKEQHLEKVFAILADLFEKTNICLSVDFMTDLVDFQQPGAFHANPQKMLDLFLTKLSRRTILDHSYLPYEFCLQAFKNVSVQRPDNIYEP